LRTLLDRDLRLVNRFLEGDKCAFDALVERHRRRVHGLAYRMTRDHDSAEDITVDVFVEVYQSLARFRGAATFRTWLHRVAVNVCLEHVRRRRAKRQVEEFPLEGQELASPDTVLDQVASRELAERVMRAIQALPLAQRAAIVMFYIKGFSQAEIARILRIPKNTVKTRIFYGTRAVRDCLEAEAASVPPKAGARA